MDTLKPLLTYYGGKQRIANKILEYMPPHFHYVEPFAGGLAVLFAKNRPKTQYLETVNDTNKDLINFYRVAIEQPDNLCTKILGTLHSKAEFEKAREILLSECDNSLLRAWAYFVGSDQSFCKKGFKHGWGYIHSTITANVSHWAQKYLKKRIRRLRFIQVENIDALSLIKKYDKPGVMFYCDPPYVGADQGGYKGYTQEDLNNLINLLDNCKGSFMLSGYANTEYPEYWAQARIKTRCAVTNNIKGSIKSRTEYLLYIDKSNNVPLGNRRYLWAPRHVSPQLTLFSN